MMKLSNVILLFALITVFACNNDDDNCNTDLQTCELDDLTWYQDMIADLEDCSFGLGERVKLYVYKHQEVIEFGSCPFILDAGLSVYSCSGSLICHRGGLLGTTDGCEDFDTQAEFIRVLHE